MQMPEEKKKNAAAVALGRRGGKKRAATLSAEQLSEQGRRAAAARWAKSKPAGEALEAREERLDAAKLEPPSPAKAEPETGKEVTVNFDSNAILALREQGYEVGEPALHPDGLTRVAVRSHDVSAWVTTGVELLDLAAGRATLEEIVNRRRREHLSAAAGQR
jgi:hypothetical protein